MNFLIEFVLVSCFLVIIGVTGGVEEIKKHVVNFIEHNGERTTCAYRSLYFNDSDYQLSLRKDGKISQDNRSLYWKGVNSTGGPLTLKICSEAKDMKQDAKILNYLKEEDSNLEEHGVPYIYYSGSIFTSYEGGAMTLFHGSLIDVKKRYKKEKLKLSDLSLLILLKGVTKALKFLSEHNVVHNNVQPENIFVYVDKIYLCNFDLATGPEDEPHNVASPPVASSNWHRSAETGILIPRTSRDDFESLLFSIWTVADMPMDPTGNPEALILSTYKNQDEAKSRFKKRCNYFKDKDAQEAFKELIDEIVSENPVPKYDRILEVLDKAISTIENKSKPERIDWMGRFTKAETSKKSKYSIPKLMSFKSLRR